MQELIVTAVIPCHNHEQWVTDAIDSVVRQDYPHKRVIVVDDGSTDNSSKRVIDMLYKPVQPAQQGEPWVCKGTFLHTPEVELMLFRFKEAHGPSFARNWGIKCAWEDTDVFAFLDSDDMYEQGKISKSIVHFQDALENVGVVYSDYDTLSSSGLRIRQYKEPFSRQRLLQECIVNCDSLISKKAFETVGVFDESLRTCEDYDLWLRVSERFILVHVPEPLVTIRVGEHSSSAVIPKEAWQKNWQRVMEKAKARAQQ